MDRISDPRSVILMDMDMDRLKKNPVPIRSESESDKINGYGYGFRSIRSEPDPLTGLRLMTHHCLCIQERGNRLPVPDLLYLE